tara:strand:+ start:3607 stop:4362 length:756 start_codon:yes stop_codon:yes gene_type:complete
MKLNQLQSQFSESLFYQHDEITKVIKETESVSPLQRLQVYRNSFIMGVTEALAITYQYTHALVGEDFFNSVSRAFILNNPPVENNIMTYGFGFDQYLKSLPQLSEMPYICEMARFEWLLEQTSNTALDEATFDVSQLALVPENELAKIKFQIPTQIALFESEQNISHLYKMLITDSVEETDLNKACYVALNKQPDFRIEIIALQQSEFLLLQQINEGKALGQITPQDLHQQLPILLEKKLLNGFTLNQENL